MQHLSRTLIAACSLLVLSACGGGGDASKPSPWAYPNSSPVKGEYQVYTETFTDLTTSPNTQGDFTFTRYIANVNDTTYQRDIFFSTGPALVNTGLTTTEEITSRLQLGDTEPTTCALDPHWREEPPLNSKVKETYEASAKETCTQKNSPNRVYALAVKGLNEDVVFLETALGRVAAFKYTQTVTSQASAQTDPQETETIREETCWVDRDLHRVIGCDDKKSRKTKDQKQATPISQAQWRLTGYALPGQAPVGNVQPRFAGSWTITLNSATSQGTCTTVKVNTQGGLTGSCKVKNTATPALGEVNMTVSGQINTAGAAQLKLSDGSTLSGTFNSIVQGQSTPAGLWSARRF